MSHWLATLAIALPWLNPFSWGPSPPVVQTLVTLVGAAVLLGLLALRQLEGVSLARAAILGWLMAALISSVMGIVQYFGASAALAPWVDGTGMGYAFANLRQPNQYATLTNIGLAALLWWAAQVPTMGEAGADRSRTHQVAVWCMAALLAVGNAISSSRTGMVQLLLLGLLVAVWRHFETRSSRRTVSALTRQLILIALAVYGLALLTMPRIVGLEPDSHGLLARLALGDRHCISRITLWGNVLHLIAQKPWLGWGWGELSYAHYITLYPGVRFCAILDNAHNLPLHLAVELGVPAAVLLCVGAIALTVRVRPWLAREPEKRVAWAVLSVILLHSMLEYPLWYGPFLTAAILCLLVLELPRPVTGFAMSTKNKPLYKTLAAALAAIVLVAIVAFAAWDYHRISQVFLEPSARDPIYQGDPLAKSKGSWLFRKHERYAELTTTPVTASNAVEMHAMALELLHFSPEPSVIEKLIESAKQLGLDDEVLAHTQRLRAAFPEESRISGKL